MFACLYLLILKQIVNIIAGTVNVFVYFEFVVMMKRTRRSSQDAGLIAVSDDKVAVPPPYRR